MGRRHTLTSAATSGDIQGDGHQQVRVFNGRCAVSLLIREKRQELRADAFQSYRIGRVVENLDAVGVEDPGEAEIGSQLVEWGGNQDDTL